MPVRSRSPRSAAFQQRQAAKSQVLAAKAQRRFTPGMARDLSGYFLGLEKRLSEDLRRRGAKADPLGPYALLRYTDLTNLANSPAFWNEEKLWLNKTLQSSMMKVGVAGVQGSAIITGTAASFNLQNPDVQDMRWRIAKEVRGITAETQKRLQNAIGQGIKNGEHPSVIAKGLLAQARGWAGLENLTASRAYTIARTETANAFNWTALLQYKRSGIVEKVVCHDAPDCGWIGHNGSELANGTHRTLTEAGNHPISHPNCVRAFSPAFGAEEPGVRDRKQVGPPPPGPAELDPALWANPRRFTGGKHGAGGSPLEEWSHDIWARGRTRVPDASANRWGASLDDYGGAGYRTMNAHMRKEQVGNAYVQQSINEIRDYIDTMRTSETVVVHRGIGSGKAVFGRNVVGEHEDGLRIEASQIVGQTFKEDGFMSTALDSKSAFPGTQLELTVPKGYKAIPVSYEAKRPDGVARGLVSDTLGQSMGEAELLLQEGAEYVIDSFRISPNPYGRGSVVTLVGRVLPRP